MPLYEFKCTKCGKTFEKIKPYGCKHPECCGQPMTKIINPPGLVFKGEGWTPKGGA